MRPFTAYPSFFEVPDVVGRRSIILRPVWTKPLLLHTTIFLRLSIIKTYEGLINAQISLRQIKEKSNSKYVSEFLFSFCKLGKYL